MTITPKTGDPAQQRMFLFMPLIFLFICYNYASGLALYWTVQNLFFVAQMYLTRKQAHAPLLKLPRVLKLPSEELSINVIATPPGKHGSQGDIGYDAWLPRLRRRHSGSRD